MRVNENKYKPISYSNVIMCMKFNEDKDNTNKQQERLYEFSTYAKASIRKTTKLLKYHIHILNHIG